MKTITKALLATALCAGLATTAYAGQINLGPTVNVLGTNYSVSLIYNDQDNSALQSFNALNPTITFTTSAAALAAAQALRDVFGAGFDWHPASTNNGTRIPFAATATTYDYTTVSDCCGPPNFYGPFLNTSRDDANLFSFALFTPNSTSPVPEPEAFALMLLGLASLQFIRRRQQA